MYFATAAERNWPRTILVITLQVLGNYFRISKNFTETVLVLPLTVKLRRDTLLVYVFWVTVLPFLQSFLSSIFFSYFSLSRIVDIIVEKILGRIMTEIKIRVRRQKTSRAINTRNRNGEINTLTATVVIDDSRFTIFFRTIKRK